MSVKALSAVFEDSRARDSAFVVLLAMADWADHNGRCYPSYGQIAEKARVSRATAIAAVTELVKLGELERVEQGKAPTEDDDESPAKVRAQWRNLYRIALVKTRSQVVQLSDHQAAPEPKPQVVQPSDPLENEVVQPSDGLSDGADALGSPVNAAQVVQPTGSHIRSRPSGRPSDLKAGAPPRAPLEQNPEDNLGVITKLAHETITLLGSKADLGDLAEAVKSQCSQLHIVHWPGDVVRRAIDSALYQRTHARGVR